MFTVDPQTRMAWLQPLCLTPLYMFQLIGILMSLAVFHGITLPVTFPLALYRKLLGMPVTELNHISDGWPELAKGLSFLLSQDAGNVEELSISYSFDIDQFGQIVSVDIEDPEAEWPLVTIDSHGIPSTEVYGAVASPEENNTRHDSELTSEDVAKVSTARHPSPGASMEARNVDEGIDGVEPDGGYNVEKGDENAGEDAVTEESSIHATASHIRFREQTMVTNQNRHQYIRDRIYWLTEKTIRAQFEMLEKGFFTCIDPKALSLFTPESLQTLVEGSQDIDLDQLEEHTEYESGYSAESTIVKDFWRAVRDLSPEQIRRLLVFVTATDRVPAKGMVDVQFVVQRSGNDDSVCILLSIRFPLHLLLSVILCNLPTTALTDIEDPAASSHEYDMLWSSASSRIFIGEDPARSLDGGVGKL